MADQELYEDRKAREAEERGDFVDAALWRRIKATVDLAPPLGVQQKALLRSLLTQPAVPHQARKTA